jgi:hypothetical protein
VIVSLIIYLARDVVALHYGVVRGSGRANHHRRGQVSGSKIPDTCLAASATRLLMIAIVGASFVTLTMPLLRGGDDRLARLASALDAVLLPTVALAADTNLRSASRAFELPLVEHVLKRADFLPWNAYRARVRPSTRPRTTRKARSANSWPSSFRRFNSTS